LPTQRLFACSFFAVFLLMTTAVASSTPSVVDIPASDGTKLKATYFSAGKPGPGVLLMHQCNRQRKVWDGLAQQLSAAGINVLTFDYRGFGESGGVPEPQLTPREIGKQRAKWADDIEVAFKYLVSQPGITKDMIGVGGASCGVDNSIQTAIRHPEVHSLVLLSGPTNQKGRQFLRNASNGPEFFAAADDDEFPGTVVEMEWLYNITGNPGKAYVHETTGGHGADMFKMHPELVTAITDWYVTTLIKTPGHAPASTANFKPSEQVQALSMIDQPGGAQKVNQMLSDWRKKDPNATLFPEGTANIIGYEFLQAGDNKSAVEVLKLNVDAYPNSPNAYDSLGDAYLAAGQKDLALEASKKTLELLQTDTKDPQQQKDAIKTSAEGKIKQLSAPVQ
jgi:dienelactone hydrolase